MLPPALRKINVIDMYHGNNVPDGAFVQLKNAGVMGIIHKASQGSHYDDPAYQSRRKAAEAAGLLWGAYHFLDASDAEAQAKMFLDAAGCTDAAPCLLAADFEDYGGNSASLSQLVTFMKYVDAMSPVGVHTVLYSGNRIRETLKPHPGGHQDQAMIAVEGFFQQHRLWLAEYGPKEQVPWPWCDPIVKSSAESTAMPSPGVFLWQFTEKGRASGLPGMTDGNFFDGTFDDLKARWLA